MQNILFIHPDPSPRFRRIAQRLAKHGHRVLFLSDKNTEGEVTLVGVEQLHYHPGKKQKKGKSSPTAHESKRNEAAVEACGLLAQRGFAADVVCASASLGCAASLRELFPNARVIVDFEELRGAGSEGGGAFRADGESVRELEACDLGIVATRRGLECFPMTLQGKLTVIHAGIDTAFFSPTDAPLGIPELPDDAPLVVCVSNGEESETRITAFLDAMEEVLAARADAHLVIALDGPPSVSDPSSATARAWEKRLIARGKLPRERAHRLAALQEGQYRRLLGRSAAFVCLEALFGPPRTLLEAMACGAPAIAPGDGATGEPLVHETNCLLCDFGKVEEVAAAIRRALDDGDALAPMREAARNAVIAGYALDMESSELERLLLGDAAHDDDDDDDDVWADDEDAPRVEIIKGGGEASASADEDEAEAEAEPGEAPDRPLAPAMPATEAAPPAATAPAGVAPETRAVLAAAAPPSPAAAPHAPDEVEPDRPLPVPDAPVLAVPVTTRKATPPKVPREHVYIFFNIYIYEPYTGIESAVMKRAMLFERQLGIIPIYLQSDYNVGYQDRIRQLYREGKVTKNFRHASIYAFFQALTDNPIAPQAPVAPDDREAEDVSKQGRKIFTRFYRRETRRCSFVRHYNPQGKLNRIDIYDYDGYLSRVATNDPETGLPLGETYYRRDGSVCITVQFGKNRNNEYAADSIYVYDPQGEIKCAFTDRHNLEVFLLHVYLNQMFDEHHVVHIFAERSYQIPEWAAVHYDVKPQLNIISFVHSSHLDRPDDPDGPIKAFTFMTKPQYFREIPAMITPTRQQRDDIVRRCGDYGNVFSIPHAAEYYPARVPFASRERHKVVALARLSEEKRHDKMIRIFAKVVAKLPSATLDIYGHGAEKQKLQALIAELKLENNVKLREFIADKYEVYATFSRARMSLLTSRFEGFALVVLESLASGCPVLSVDVRYGPADLIQHGKNGFILGEDDDAFAERIVAVLTNPELNARLSENAYESALKYSEERVAELWRAFVAKMEAEFAGERETPWSRKILL